MYNLTFKFSSLFIGYLYKAGILLLLGYMILSAIFYFAYASREKNCSRRDWKELTSSESDESSEILVEMANKSSPSIT